VTEDSLKAKEEVRDFASVTTSQLYHELLDALEFIRALAADVTYASYPLEDLENNHQPTYQATRAIAWLKEHGITDIPTYESTHPRKP